jgi:hypothetical protein
MVARSDVKRAAEELRSWAERVGVFSQGRSSRPMPSLDVAAAGGMFAAGAVETFVAKPITAVGFAAPKHAEPTLYVYTRRKLTRAEEASLSADLRSDIPVAFRVAQPLSVTTPSAASRTPVVTRESRLCCGSSISIGNTREAGTLGALLRSPEGTVFGLSCNHVVGGCSNARRDVPIVSPGILDVGAGAPLPRFVGLHRRALPFVQGDPVAVPGYRDNQDAAIFEIADPASVTSWQGEAFDTPAMVAEPEEDSPVEKVGRTTGHTFGTIESRLVGPLRVDYDMIVHHSAEENISFRGTVYFEPVYLVRGSGGSFALAGDSGSIVVRREGAADPTAAVGLVIGGRGEETYMVPLKPILTALGLDLASGH